jgi:DNA-directed RNA polymerase subunit alpha
VRIEGVSHEFSPIPGVVEDATDIILNLKQVPFKMMGEGMRIARLRVRRPWRSDEQPDRNRRDVEVLDRNLHIATVGEGGKLDIEMRIKSGRGYVSADRNYDEDLPIGYIPIDSVHSPVRKVNYTVEAARLGQNTDYDKLTIEVWTNGAISPQDAIGQAAKLLKDHMTIFINFEETPELPRSRRARGQPDERSAEPLGGRAGAQRPFLQLPEERQHSDHRRSGSEERIGDVAHQELRPQVAERNQGNPFGSGLELRHEV